MGRFIAPYASKCIARNVGGVWDEFPVF